MANPFINENNIDITSKYDVHKSFQRTREPYMKGIPVAFITTTRMNLSVVNSNRDNFFSEMSVNMPEIYGSLSSHPTTSDAPIIDTSWNGICGNVLNSVIKWKGGTKAEDGYLNPFNGYSPFIPILSNCFLGLDGKDAAAKTTEIGETFYGYKQTISGPMIDSITGDVVTVKYNELKYLPIVKLHKLWMEYRENVGRGLFIPYEDVRANFEIDFASTLYYFVLDVDFQTILYYSRYVGIVPISNPYSALTSNYTDSNAREIPDIAIDYVYSYKQDLNPEILVDFNRISTCQYSKLDGASNLGQEITIPFANSYKYDYSEIKAFNNPVIVKEKINGRDTVTPRFKFKLYYE